MDFSKLDKRHQKVIIEYNDGDWMVLFDSGDIRSFETPEKALKAVQKAAGKGNKDVTFTHIEWRGTPAGFVPPKGAM